MKNIQEKNFPRLKRKTDFKNNECYYDIHDADDLARLNVDFRDKHHRSFNEVLLDDTIKWPEFSNMIAALGGETLTAYYASIRAEKDPVKIRKFTPSQRKIYLDWKKKHKQTVVVRYKSEEEILSRSNSFIEALRKTGNMVEK